MEGNRTTCGQFKICISSVYTKWNTESYAGADGMEMEGNGYNLHSIYTQNRLFWKQTHSDCDQRNIRKLKNGNVLYQRCHFGVRTEFSLRPCGVQVPCVLHLYYTPQNAELSSTGLIGH